MSAWKFDHKAKQETGGTMSISHPDNGNITVSYERITPERAAQYLEKNVANRPVRQKNLRKINSDLPKRWNNENPDPIVFSASGALDNGQHRLIGVVMTGVPIVALVVRGVNSGVMRTLDSGAKRSLQDVLKIENKREGTNHRNLTHISGVIVACISYERKGDLKLRSAGADVSTEQQYEFFKKDADYFNDLTSWAKSMNTKAKPFKNVLTLMRLAVLRYALDKGKADQHDIEVFFEKVCVISADDVPSSILALRARLLEAQAASDKKRAWGQDQVLALLIKSWNAYISGQEVTRLSYRAGGDRPEKFPELIFCAE